jgi:nitric oxide reductase NorE protein
MLTGIHLAHVLIGLVLLGCVWHRARRMDGRSGPMVLVEGGASYWHMVDLLWIVLFPLLYLMHTA